DPSARRLAGPPDGRSLVTARPTLTGPAAAQGLVRSAAAVLLDFDGPVTRLFPGDSWKELSARIRQEAVSSVGPELAGGAATPPGPASARGPVRSAAAGPAGCGGGGARLFPGDLGGARSGRMREGAVSCGGPARAARPAAGTGRGPAPRPLRRRATLPAGPSA